MAINKVRKYLEKWNKESEILEFNVSSATVELAAEAAGVIPARIAKTISVKTKDKESAILIVAAGDARIDNKKFKTEFDYKPKMLKFEEVEEFTGFKVGGVCPFDVKDGLKVYLDVSLQRFDSVYPACGTANSAIKLTCEELSEISKNTKWVDVCSGWSVE
jgi:prolyl-tRNA editing enzyme YbaK/EbsC (Cys-tRNA(Pro) deacylase)